MSLSPRVRAGSVKNLLSDSMPPESLLAMKALNVTIDADKEVPANCVASNIAVKVTVNLEEKSENPAATQRAAEIQECAQSTLAQTYTASEESAPYLLKVYVVLASPHSVLNKLTIGMIGAATTECLEWFLMTHNDGAQETLKAGRVGVQKARTNIATLTAELCEALIQKIGVP
jgi:hypothetical protein